MNTDKEIWRQAVILENSTIGQAIRNLDQVGIKIILVADKAYKLIGTISDGDIRRGLLNGLGLNDTISSLVNHKALVVPPEMARNLVIELMMANKIQQIPDQS